MCVYIYIIYIYIYIYIHIYLYIYIYLLISREPEILHDKRFSYQANQGFDMTFKNDFIIFYFYYY